MSTQITLTLPDEVYGRAEHLAQLQGRDVADILATMLETFLEATEPYADFEYPMESLSDDKVLALAESRMDETQNARMSELLDKQQSGMMSESEHHELSLWIGVYERGSLRKVRALAEATRRGLIEHAKP